MASELQTGAAFDGALARNSGTAKVASSFSLSFPL